MIINCIAQSDGRRTYQYLSGRLPMKRFTLTALAALFTLTATQATANDLMNYGEISVEQASSEVNNVTADGLGFTLSIDIGDNFFAGVMEAETETKVVFDSWYGQQAMKIESTTSAVFIGGAYHIDADTHLFGVVTNAKFELDGLSDTSTTYRIGVKKAFGQFVATGEYDIDSDTENSITVKGKYYFTDNVFAGLGMSFYDGETATGIKLGYTF